MRTIIRLAVAGLVAAALLAMSAPAAQAGSGDVIRTGSCSAASDWKLKLSPQDGRIEVEFEVDQNVVGDTWRVRFFRNGTLFATARATTRAPSGSFEVRRLANNGAGTNAFRVRAANLGTGEVCFGRASI
jgi:hypothetical protein